MDDLLHIDDLFTLGLGFDIGGAYLLAKSLLRSPLQIRLASSLYLDASPPALVGMAADKIAGKFGLFALLGGFLVQAAGYLISIMDIGPTNPGGTATLFAGLLAVLAATIVVQAHRRLRRHFVFKEFVKIANVNPKDGSVRDLPSGWMLVAMGGSFWRAESS
jgi:hypothetical protein